MMAAMIPALRLLSSEELSGLALVAPTPDELVLLNSIAAVIVVSGTSYLDEKRQSLHLPVNQTGVSGSSQVCGYAPNSEIPSFTAFGVAYVLAFAL
jgi:hypothetical protein